MQMQIAKPYRFVLFVYATMHRLIEFSPFTVLVLHVSISEASAIRKKSARSIVSLDSHTNLTTSLYKKP